MLVAAVDGHETVGIRLAVEVLSGEILARDDLDNELRLHLYVFCFFFFFREK